MDKRKMKSLQSRLHRHAKDSCANHMGKDGCLITGHGKCVLSFTADRPTANVCPYFMKAVGPSKPELFDEYLQYFPDGYPLKPEKPDHFLCKKCGKPTERKSNRQKYCTECADDIKRKEDQRRQQNKRASI